MLIINQQLNIIDPPEKEVVASTPTDRSIASILKPPTMPKRVKPKQRRNIKVAYGVVTSNEIINEMERQEAVEAEHEIDVEQYQIEKHDREQQIGHAEQKLREHSAKAKQSVGKKKSKKAKKDDADAKSKRLIAIKESNEQLRDLRQNLNELRSIHASAYKAIVLRKKKFLEQKKNRNLTVFTISSGS